MKSYKKYISVMIPWLALGVLLNLGRLFLADSQSYIYMNWNVFLALLPVLFAWLLEYKTKFKVLSTVVFFAWLFFLPNAPYIITDFIHLRDVGTEVMLWYDAMMIFAYAFVGVYSFAFSLDRVVKVLKQSHMFIFLASFASAFGLYLGRYIRLNSWDVVTRPLEALHSIGDFILHKGDGIILALTLLVFTVAMMIMYYSYRNLIKKD